MKKYNEIGSRVLDIIFADAKLTWERLVCIFSALFWIWLEISFIKFFFNFAFGMVAYVATDSFALSWETLIINNGLINTLTIILVLVITIFRIPLFKPKQIKE